jgi:beta-lactamase regulating signal transducer with metallopeptidase domain/outer membrane lipoprotein-sorting protein
MNLSTSAVLASHEGLWLAFLLNLFVKGTLLLMIAAAASQLLHHSPAALRHLIWKLALAGLLALPILSLALPAWRTPIVSEILLPDGSAPAGPMPQIDVFRNNEPRVARPRNLIAGLLDWFPSRVLLVPRNSAFHEAGSGMPSASSHALFVSNWSIWIVALWLAGAAVVIARWLIGTTRIRRMLRHARQVSDSSWSFLMEELIAKLRIKSKVSLRQSNHAVMPMTFGFRAPSILLPPHANRWSEGRRRVVLMHELVHVKQRDHLAQMGAQLVCAWYWFHPLVWWAAGQLRMEQERACDDQVLNAGARPSEYAFHLLGVLRSLKSVKKYSPPAVTMASGSELEKRLHDILNPVLRRRTLGRLTRLIAVTGAACIVLPVSSVCPSARWEGRAEETGMSSAQQPSLEELIRKGVAAQGGKEKLRALRTIKIMGTMVTPPVTVDGVQRREPAGEAGFPITVYTKRPNLARLEMAMQGKTSFVLYDGHTAWSDVNSPDGVPVQGDDSVGLLVGSMVRKLAQLTRSLEDYQRWGAVELLGKDMVAGREVFKLRVSSPGELRLVFLDGASMMKVKELDRHDDFETETDYADFRTVDGLRLPNLIEFKAHGGQTFARIMAQKIETNIPISDDVFKPVPPPPPPPPPPRASHGKRPLPPPPPPPPPPG